MLTEPWILTSMNDDEARTGIFKFVSLVEISNDHIMVYGRLAGDDTPSKIAVYDLEGKPAAAFLGGDQHEDPWLIFGKSQGE